MTIQIEVNGEPRQVHPRTTVTDLLEELGRDPRTVAVEHNGRVLARGRFGEVRLEEGDRLEVVHFVQGGQTAPVRRLVFSRQSRYIASGLGR